MAAFPGFEDITSDRNLRRFLLVVNLSPILCLGNTCSTNRSLHESIFMSTFGMTKIFMSMALLENWGLVTLLARISTASKCVSISLSQSLYDFQRGSGSWSLLTACWSHWRSSSCSSSNQHPLPCWAPPNDGHQVQMQCSGSSIGYQNHWLVAGGHIQRPRCDSDCLCKLAIPGLDRQTCYKMPGGLLQLWWRIWAAHIWGDEIPYMCLECRVRRACQL